MRTIRIILLGIFIVFGILTLRDVVVYGSINIAAFYISLMFGMAAAI